MLSKYKEEWQYLDQPPLDLWSQKLDKKQQRNLDVDHGRIVVTLDGGNSSLSWSVVTLFAIAMATIMALSMYLYITWRGYGMGNCNYKLIEDTDCTETAYLH